MCIIQCNDRCLAITLRSIPKLLLVFGPALVELAAASQHNIDGDAVVARGPQGARRQRGAAERRERGVRFRCSAHACGHAKAAEPTLLH